MHDDAEIGLMGRYCDGDTVAFHQLYALVAPRLLAYLTSLAGDRATAQDLLQQTFLKLHQSRSAYIRGAQLSPWLYTIAHRTFIDETRRRKHSATRFVRDLDEALEPRAEITGVAEGAGDESPYAPALAGAAMAALAQLPHSQKEALILTKIHGRTVVEAAAIAGTTPGAIKLRAHRGYVALRKLLGAQQEEA